MKRFTLLLTLAVLIASATQLLAQDAKKSSSLGKPIFPRLEYVNLNEELGLQSEMLRGFGARVDDARRDADAEAVAAQAVLLSFAEQVAGKKAQTVTASQMLEEAVRIATEQQNRDAAATIIAAARRIDGGDAIAATMNDSMAMFAQMRGEGNFIAYLQIINSVERALDVYIDGKYTGTLYGGESNVYSTGNGSTQARVTDAFGNTVSEMFFLEKDDTSVWEINP